MVPIRRSRPCARAIAVGAAVLAACAACGSAGSIGAPSTIPTRSIAPDATVSGSADRITDRIAYLGDYDLDEASSLVAPAYQGAALAAEGATTSGVLPADVEVVSYNTDGDAAKALAVAGTVAADPQIVGVIVGPFTAESRAVGQVLDAAGLSTISLSSLDATLSSAGWTRWRRAVALEADQIRALAAFARGLPSARRGVCVAGDSTPRSSALGRIAAQQLGDRASVDVAIPASDPSAQRAAASIRQARCGVVLWPGGGAGAAALRLRLAAARPGVQLVATDETKSDSYLAEAGTAADGTVVSCSCVDLTTSSRLDAQRFINAFQFDVGASPGPYAVEGWDAGNAFVDAIRAGAITRQRVTAELAGRRRYAGLAGTYAFGADGELRPRSAPIRFYRAEGGRWISLGSEDASTPFDLATPGVLTVGSCRGGPPYAFRRHGALRGFDVAVAREIARRMRLRLAWRPVACAAVHGAIEHRRIDVLTGAGRPLPRGTEGTRIYLSVREGLVTTSRQGIGGPADLRSRDRVGVVRGSTAERWARRDLTPRGVAVAAVGSPRRALRLLRRGRLDAALVDESLARARSRGSALRMVANVDAGDYRVLAVSRDDPGLLASVDAEVARLVAGRRYRALFRRWFPGVAVPPETGSP